MPLLTPWAKARPGDCWMPQNWFILWHIPEQTQQQYIAAAKFHFGWVLLTFLHRRCEDKWFMKTFFLIQDKIGTTHLFLALNRDFCQWQFTFKSQSFLHCLPCLIFVHGQADKTTPQKQQLQVLVDYWAKTGYFTNNKSTLISSDAYVQGRQGHDCTGEKRRAASLASISGWILS